MGRDFRIRGEAMVTVKSGPTSVITSLTQLGLSNDQISVVPDFYHEDLDVNAWGQAPPDVQFMLGAVNISMGLTHVDDDVVNELVRLACGAPTAAGRVARAGTRLGAGANRFAAGWKYVELGITAPQEGDPFRFYNAYLANQYSEDMGVRRSLFQLNFRVILYTPDPWQAGSGAAEQILWDRIAAS